jgi:hypothetical protein
MKKIFIGIIVLVVIILAIVLMLPSTQYQISKMLNPTASNGTDENKETLTVDNIDQNKIDDIFNAFDNCDQVTENFAYDAYEFEGKITGKENDKCLVTLTLVDAPGLEAFAVGSKADCKLSRAELDALQNDMNMDNLDCSGPLFDLAKAFIK